MLEMKLIVHGRVQGVGYRNSIINHIESNQILVKGYITNKPNGTVEIMAQGSIEDLKDIRRFAVTGSSFSDVRDIEEVVGEVTDTSFASFDIRY